MKHGCILKQSAQKKKKQWKNCLENGCAITILISRPDPKNAVELEFPFTGTKEHKIFQHENALVHEVSSMKTCFTKAGVEEC